MTQRVSSPAATGGAGERFEEQVAAFSLALLLSRAAAPVLVDASVVQVHLQAEHLGWHTDDILIIAERSPRVERKLAIQAKLSFSVSASDDDCIKTVRAMWDDFLATGRFNPELDRLAVATQHGTAALLVSFERLLGCARASVSADDFSRRVALDGYLDKQSRRQNDVLRGIIGEYTEQPIDEDQYWRFLRVIAVISLDLGTAGAQSEALIRTLLAHTAQGVSDPVEAAREAWSTLLETASTGRARAESFFRSTLPQALLSIFHTVKDADSRALKALFGHGQTVRNSIRSQIGGSLAIERANYASSLVEAVAASQVVIVSGAAGAGKSALAKRFLDSVDDRLPVLGFQAVEFAKAHLDELLANTTTGLNAQSFFSLLAGHDEILVFVDGVERLLEHTVRDAFKQLLHVAEETRPVRILLTCRDYTLETVRSALLPAIGLRVSIVELGSFTDEELAIVEKEVPTLAPALADPKMRSLLRTPYLLDIASRLDWRTGPLPRSIRDFRLKCWRDIIRDDAHPAGGLPRRRELAFVDIARRRAADLRPYVKSEAGDTEALQALSMDSLLRSPTDSLALFAPAHDVLEDWALIHLIDDVELTADDIGPALAEVVGGLPALRRALRRWLAERLETAPTATRAMLLGIARRTELPQYFRDDCIVAALMSDEAASFLDGCRPQIDDGDIELLRQIARVLRVACKAVPPWLHSAQAPSLGLVPTGPGWAPTVQLVADALPIAAEQQDVFSWLGLIEDWARQLQIEQPTAEGAEAVGRIVAWLLPHCVEYGSNETRRRALEVLLKVPNHSPLFDDLLTRAIAREQDAVRDGLAREFAQLAVSTVSSAFVARDRPDAIMALIRAQFVMGGANQREHSLGWSSADIGEFFGIREAAGTQFFPASALQGPFKSLLRFHPQDAVAFIIELLNHSGSWYGEMRWPDHNLEPAEPLVLYLASGDAVEQWANPRLFLLYRGLTVGPYLLQSALMALEQWLLEVGKYEQVDLDAWLVHILRGSNNVMATGVVASLCCAYPLRAPYALLGLLSSPSLVVWDAHRIVQDRSGATEFLAGLITSHVLYEAERRASNALPHRKTTLEDVARQLQLTEHREAVWRVIDRQREALKEAGEEEVLIERLRLHRMDLRGYQVVNPPADASPELLEKGVFVAPGLEPEVQQMVDKHAERLDVLNRHLGLLQQARRAWDRDDRSSDVTWRSLLSQAIATSASPDVPEDWAAGGIGIVAALCIRDHWTELAPEELQWCLERIVYELDMSETNVDPMSRHSRLFGPDRAAAAVAASIVKREDLPATFDSLEFLARVMTHPVAEVVTYAYDGIARNLREHRSLLIGCAAAAAREAEVRDRSSHLITNGDEELLDVSFAEEPPRASSTDLRDAVRRALSLDVAESARAIEDVQLITWPGRRAAIRIAQLLHPLTGDDVARAFFRRATEWLATMLGTRHRGGVEGRDYDAELTLSRSIASYVLHAPPDQALSVCAPLIDLVAAHPEKVADFIGHLILAADANIVDSFWALWQAFADATLVAPWISRLNREHPSGQTLIDRLFLLTYWKQGVQHWHRLDGESRRLDALAERLPVSPVCVEAYTRFLYTVGRRSLPEAFTIVTAILEKGDAVTIASHADIGFYLESVLAQYVYGEPYRLKSDAGLRRAVLKLLDYLVSAGSPAAYRMRDDFVTPSV